MNNVLIVGARRGVGLELARLYATSQAVVDVHATVRNVSVPGTALRALRNVALYELDVRNISQIASLAQKLRRRGVTVGTLLYVSGVNVGTYAEQWLVNALAPFRVIDQVLPSMPRGSKVCIVTSLAGTSKQIQLFERANYPIASARCDAAAEAAGCAYKKSQKARNDAFREHEAQWRQRGITAVAIHPGYVRTAMNNFSGKISPAQSAAGIRRVCMSSGGGAASAPMNSRMRRGDHEPAASALLSWEGRRLPW